MEIEQVAKQLEQQIRQNYDDPEHFRKNPMELIDLVKNIKTLSKYQCNLEIVAEVYHCFICNDIVNVSKKKTFCRHAQECDRLMHSDCLFKLFSEQPGKCHCQRVLKCPNCQDDITQYVRDKDLEINGQGGQKLPCFCPKLYPCALSEVNCCDDQKKENMITVNLECNHELCRDCFMGQIDLEKEKQNTSEFNINKIPCPAIVDPEKEVNNTCDRMISPFVIQEYYREAYDFITYQNLNRKADVTCPNISCGWIFDSEKRKNNYNCPKCQQTICHECKLKEHKGSNCSKNIKEILRNTFPEEQKQLNQFRFRFCPNCTIPYEKDEKCDHVDCPVCFQQFCYPCSALRQPTLAHDMQYHRDGCKNKREDLVKDAPPPEPIVQCKRNCAEDEKSQKNCKEVGHYCMECKRLTEEKGEVTLCPLPVGYNEFIEQVCQKLDIGNEKLDDKIIRSKICLNYQDSEVFQFYKENPDTNIIIE